MFQIQSWQSSAPCTCDPPGPRERHQRGCAYPVATRSWVPMEDGAAKAHWKPRKVAQDAVYLAMSWTGLTGIPAMQVVDLDTGDVIWREADQVYFAGAGPLITPEWAPKLAAQVRREQERRAAAEQEKADPKPRSGSRTAPQGALW